MREGYQKRCGKASACPALREILVFLDGDYAMKKAFPGHFANDPDDLQRLWGDCLIAVDANVLLSLYRYSEGTRGEFVDVFEKLVGRLWVPHQVAKEYLKNRLKVISDQAKTYDAAIKGLKELRAKFEDPKQHPFVSAEVLGDCTRSFDLIIGELQLNQEKHDRKVNDDDIKAKISHIFDGKVGAPFSNEQLESIIKDGAVRYADKVPPGFKDSDKAGGTSLEDRLAPYGDYIGWLQLIDKAKESGKGIIYVTGDNKEDWWLKQSGRTIGPLPSLIDEFLERTSQRFYMYLPDVFLKRAGEFLHKEVSVQAMDEAREVRLEDTDAVVASDHVDVGALNEFLVNYRTSKAANLQQELYRARSLEEGLKGLKGLNFNNWIGAQRVVSTYSQLFTLERKLTRIRSEQARRDAGHAVEEFEDFDYEYLAQLASELTEQITAMRVELAVRYRPGVDEGEAP